MRAPVTASVTWRELENGHRLRGECACGRALYVRSTEGGVMRCDGCGEPIGGCMCPPVRRDLVPA